MAGDSGRGIANNIYGLHIVVASADHIEQFEQHEDLDRHWAAWWAVYVWYKFGTARAGFPRVMPTWLQSFAPIPKLQTARQHRIWSDCQVKTLWNCSATQMLRNNFRISRCFAEQLEGDSNMWLPGLQNGKIIAEAPWWQNSHFTIISTSVPTCCHLWSAASVPPEPHWPRSIFNNFTSLSRCCLLSLASLVGGGLACLFSLTHWSLRCFRHRLWYCLPQLF